MTLIRRLPTILSPLSVGVRTPTLERNTGLFATVGDSTGPKWVTCASKLERTCSESKEKSPGLVSDFVDVKNDMRCNAYLH